MYQNEITVILKLFRTQSGYSKVISDSIADAVGKYQSY